MIDIVEELHLGANILLAYFHYCCKGCRPFDLDWDAADTQSMAELDPDQIKFVQETSKFVHSNSKTTLSPQFLQLVSDFFQSVEISGDEGEEYV